MAIAGLPVSLWSGHDPHRRNAHRARWHRIPVGNHATVMDADMTYDHWKTTEPEDYRMPSVSKSTRYQQYADIIFLISDSVSELADLLDKAESELPIEIWSKVQTAFPIAREIGPKSNGSLRNLAHSLEPPDDHD